MVNDLHYGDFLEMSYKKIHAGGGAIYGELILRLVGTLSKLAGAGMIAYSTWKKIKEFFLKDVEPSEMKVISRNSVNVVMVNTETYEQESFNLVDHIKWVTDELCNDLIMKKLLCGRNNFEGIKQILNSYSKEKYRLSINEKIIDCCVCGDNVFYTQRAGNGIRLYKHTVDSFPELDPGHGDVRVIKDRLVNGRLYRLDDMSIAVETSYGYIAKLVYGSEKHYCTKIRGAVFSQLEDGSILFFRDGNLLRLKRNGKCKIILNDISDKIIYTEGAKVFWKKRLRDKEILDFTTEIQSSFAHVGKEMLWKGLLAALYDEHFNFNECVGKRLKFSYFFDKIPVPFTMDEILRRLSEVEEYCYWGDLTKTGDYPMVMSYLMSFEGKNADSKETFKELYNL